jgi:hypothetical protein
VTPYVLQQIQLLAHRDPDCFKNLRSPFPVSLSGFPWFFQALYQGTASAGP